MNAAERDPGFKMSAETWRAYCTAIMSMKGPAQNADKQERPERAFKCDRCGKEWSTGMKLDGVKHKAILNECGGIWRART